MYHTAANRRTRVELQAYLTDVLPQLLSIKEEGDRSKFNALMLKLLPGVRQYLGRRLQRARKNGLLPAGKYQLADFVDELFIWAYDHIQEVTQGEDLQLWLFRKADEILDDALVEEDFDNTFFDNIDDYSQQEWAAMEERISTDGDGDLVLEEELDDPSYPKYDYVLSDVFVDDREEELIDRISQQMRADEIHRHIDLILHRLPAVQQTVFELAVNQRFTPEEIAAVKQISIGEVEDYLAEVRQRLRLSFRSRSSGLENGTERL
jgi:RNA polymerase sigma factor (sigma-70 family)